MTTDFPHPTAVSISVIEGPCIIFLTTFYWAGDKFNSNSYSKFALSEFRRVFESVESSGGRLPSMIVCYGKWSFGFKQKLATAPLILAKSDDEKNWLEPLPIGTMHHL